MTSLSPFSPLRRSTWLVGLLLGSAGLLAQAQTAPTAPSGHAGPHMQARHGDRGAHMAERISGMQARQAQRLQELKGKLQLTPIQESAWSRFSEGMQARPAAAGAHAAMHQELGALSTPERLERMKTLRAQHQSEMNAFMDRRFEATRALYAALTPEQQKVFDAETARMMQARGSGHHPQHHHPQGAGPGARG